MKITLDEILQDPNLTPEMIEFLLSCKQAEEDYRNGKFKPVDADLNLPAWDSWTGNHDQEATF